MPEPLGVASAPDGGVDPSSATRSLQSPGCSASSTLTCRACAWRSVFESASRTTASRQLVTAGGASVASTRQATSTPDPAQAASAAARTCTERSQLSSRRSCTLVRTSSSASRSVSATSAKPLSHSCPTWTTRCASACTTARVSRWPTLSWISRAMRARSESVARRTS